MKRLRSLAISAAVAAVALLVPATPVMSQCGGQGDFLFELISVNNDGSGPGSQVTLRLTGVPGAHVCLACDIGTGSTNLLDLGTACLPFSPNLIEFLVVLPPSGVAEFTVNVPTFQVEALLCCQALAIDANAPNSLAISGRICIGEEPCDGGGVHSIGHTTKLSNVTSFPTTVTSSVHGRAGGGGDPSTSVSFDPNAQPTFPIDGGNGVFIENIVHVGDDLYVTTYVVASPSLSHQSHAGRLPNECEFTVTGGGDSNVQTIHTSCSQPLGVGMVFGDFTVTELTPH